MPTPPLRTHADILRDFDALSQKHSAEYRELFARHRSDPEPLQQECAALGHLLGRPDLTVDKDMRQCRICRAWVSAPKQEV